MSKTDNVDGNAVGMGKMRVLHPLRLNDGATGDSDIRGDHVGIAIDVETTGLNSRSGKIIELAVRRFRYDDAGVITHVDKSFSWLEDPGVPLEPSVSALTRLTDEDIAGREIDEQAATRLLNSASFVVAHNSRFDRTWVEDRLPDATGLAWCCSMSQVDWRSRGFDGRVLGYLLLQSGYYHCGHRASSDVDALIQMLRHRNSDDRTALSEMIVSGSAQSWLVRARGAAFDVKDLLRTRDYRWDANDKVWAKEVCDEQLEPEQFWLTANVYASTANPKAIAPEIICITPYTRFL